MNFNDYQILAHRTSAFRKDNPQSDYHLCMAALGLIGESGEFADLVKKHFFHSHPYDSYKLKDELSDVLWYVAEACTAIGITLENLAVHNIDKLKSRYPEGFSSDASINRSE
jgi:NTP pyrophosphatase (non-canonical NTP hydrolase)